MKIEAYINCLHDSNIKLFYIFDSLNKQYFDNETTSIRVDNVTFDIEPAIIHAKCQFIPQMSSLTMNKALEREYNMQMLQFVMNIPLIWNDIKNQKLCLDIVFRGMNDAWGNNSDKLLPSDADMQNAQDKVDLLTQAIMQQQMQAQQMEEQQQGAEPIKQSSQNVNIQKSVGAQGRSVPKDMISTQ